MLFEKFNFFVNLLRKPFDSRNGKKNSPAHVNIQKERLQQTQQDNELTQDKTSVVCSKVPPSKVHHILRILGCKTVH